MTEATATLDTIATLSPAAQAIAAALTVINIKTTAITLQPGEHYAGLTIDAETGQAHHLVLLPGEAEDLNLAEAQAWAAAQGARLPTRDESALLYANLRSHFNDDEWYWTSTPAGAGRAWSQVFGYGYQDLSRTNFECRARLVRSFPA